VNYNSFILFIFNFLNIFRGLDIFFLNNQGLSGQLPYNEVEYNSIGIHLQKKGYKIASLYYINDNIPCTMSYGYKLIDISIISQSSKLIVGINSGPMAACLTKINRQRNVLFYSYDRNNTYTFNCAENHQCMNELKNIQLPIEPSFTK